MHRLSAADICRLIQYRAGQNSNCWKPWLPAFRVTTKQGISGLVAEAGVEYLEAETPEDFVAQISGLWDNLFLRVSAANTYG
jgi:hypothetical protein